jgi:hypothetical protein
MTETARDGEQWDRRAFLRAAGALAAGAAAAGCDVPGAAGGGPAPAPGATPAAGRVREVGLDRATLVAVGEVVLPGELGATGRASAVDAFVAWVAGYEPVAERMHGYGYADVRYLPPDPAPGWRAQLEGLELLARRSRAGHVALALLAHWASSPAAWDLAYGARITPASCRPLGDAPRRPLPLASAPRA